MDLISTIVSEGGSSEDSGSETGTDTDLGVTPMEHVMDDLAFVAAVVAADFGLVCASPTPAAPLRPRAESASSESSVGSDDSEPPTRATDPACEAAPLEDMDLLAEEEADGITGCEIPRTRHEVLPSELPDESVAAETVRLRPGDALLLSGEVHAVIPEERCIVVRSKETRAALAEESVLCVLASGGCSAAAQRLVVTADGEDAAGAVPAGAVDILGAVKEVFGPLNRPFYLLRVSHTDPIDPSGPLGPVESPPTGANAVRVGAAVYCLQRSAHTIQEEMLAAMHAKGSDASNVYDEEVTGSDIDYSDDEAEQAAKAKVKASRRARPEGDGDRRRGTGRGRSSARAEGATRPSGSGAGSALPPSQPWQAAPVAPAYAYAWTQPQYMVGYPPQYSPAAMHYGAHPFLQPPMPPQQWTYPAAPPLPPGPPPPQS